MALTNTLAPQLTFSTQDNNRRPGLTGLYLPVGTTVADATTFATAARGPFLALTQNKLLGVPITYTLREDAPVAAPKSSESERKLVLVFDIDGGRGQVIQYIPSPVFDIETDNTDEVNVADPLVAAYATVIVSGAIGPNNGAVNQYGTQITGLRRAYIAHVKS